MLTQWSMTQQVVLGIFAATFLYQVYFYLRYILAAVLRTKPRKVDAADSPVQQPGVSVIVCARNEERNLRDYLQALLTQDYPEFEVIVVNDGSIDDTRTYLEYWQKRYRNLKLTFVPAGAKVGSTKKLAITLGAKAAQYDYLLLTDADCRPESTHWISEMMKGFALPSVSEAVSQRSGQSAQQSVSEAVSQRSHLSAQPSVSAAVCQRSGLSAQRSVSEAVCIVLGFGAYFAKPGLLNRMIQFDTLFNGLQYLGMAACGHPYMGVGRNLAYSKRLFFQQGGFYHLMTSKAGDDDLFVNRVATAENTAVVCTPDSLTWSVPKTNLIDWFRQKRRHLSVAPKYKSSSKFRLTLEPLTRGLLYAALIILVVLGCQQPAQGRWIPAIIAASAMLVRWIMQCVLLNIPAHRWGTTKTFLLLPVWEIVLPVISLVMMLIEPLRPKSKRW